MSCSLKLAELILTLIGTSGPLCIHARGSGICDVEDHGVKQTPPKLGRAHLVLGRKPELKL
ncbi:hypothetical protein BC938DRAFT_484009 [Jimgerdemannia flammicorona]|uniref:Uncharacterized protein n=1 Tax=Jimgerdemannia flammicorona TaxID=994334 RepID=A0A433QAN8_9FUNG|nr:hypothetical protein BC938DRAFT_484009 [Jimgerdemannia flammicorona]